MRRFLLLLPLLAACGSSLAGGRFESPGVFVHNNLPYRVGYASTSAEIPGEGWRLDNFRVAVRDVIEAKTAGRFTTKLHLDPDDRGVATQDVDAPTFDLLYGHEDTAGTIWLSTAPMSRALRDRDLRVIARDLVEDAAGKIEESALISRHGDSVVATEGHEVATVRVEEARCRLGDTEAYRVDFDTVDVDQLRLDPEARRRRVRVVLVRTSYEHKFGHVTTTFRILMTIGYSNRAEDFAKQLPDFDRFLGEIGLGAPGGEPPPRPSGFRCEPPVTRPAPPPAGAQAPAAPPSTGSPPAPVEVDAGSAP
jgi:hypothetical protein